jgi:anti-sigma factor RsiW
MNCDELKRVLNDFLNGSLSGEKSREVRLHLASCTACASALDPSDRIEILPLLDDEIEPSGTFSARFHSRLRKRRSIAVWGLSWKLAAAGILMILIASGIFLGQYFHRVPGMPESSNDLSLAEDLPLLEDMAIVSHLDLLENFDAIEKLTKEERELK